MNYIEDLLQCIALLDRSNIKVKDLFITKDHMKQILGELGGKVIYQKNGDGIVVFYKRREIRINQIE